MRRLKLHVTPQIGEFTCDVLEEMRAESEILPNLQTLEWVAVNNRPLYTVGYFLHSRVKKFVLYLGQDTLDLQRDMFKFFAGFMPNLSFLDIRANIPVRDFEDDLIYFLQKLPKLQDVVFPFYYLTTNIAKCLSDMEHLSSIDVLRDDSDDELFSGDLVDVASFNPTLTESAFPLLSRLSMFVKYDDATRFIKAPFSLSKLTHFYNDSDGLIETPDCVHQLLSALSENCPLVKVIELSSILDASVTNITDQPPGYIALDTLKPIFKLPHLVIFELQHQYPLRMTQQDITLLASSCPALENIRLGIDTVYLTESTLTLAALIPFAQHCPKLEHLGLFVNATAIAVPEISPTAALKPFKSLRYLYMGYSVIDKWLTPAIYLSQLLAPECEITTEPLWDEDNDINEELSSIKEVRSELWEKAKTTVPMLSKVRVQDWGKMRDIIEDLRGSDAILQDPMDVSKRLESLLAALELEGESKGLAL